MIPARTVEIAQKTGRALAQTGIGGEVRVEVPKLDDAAWRFGDIHLLQDMGRFQSAFDIADRKALIDQAILTLDEFYVHKDLKWARHAVDAGCALRSLRRVCDRLDDLGFHARVAAIMKSLRDIHTVYILPEPYRSLVAFLPFTMAACRDGEGDAAPERFLVTRLLPGFAPAHFGPGSEILSWNGLPIGEAVRDAGEKECAANDAALVALGVRLMTIRWLGTSTPPPASWVTLGYLDDALQHREMRLSWRLLKLAQDSNLMLPIQAVWKLEQAEAVSPGVTSAALDQRSLVEDGTVHRMFAGVADMTTYPKEARWLAVLKEVVVIHGMAATADAADPEQDTDAQAPTESEFFSAEVYETTVDGVEMTYGHLRIHGFNTPPDLVPDFIAEFRALLRRLRKKAPEYLLVDVRSNPGGDLNAAERIVQLLTPKTVEPLPFQFRATRILERFITNDGGTPQADNAGWVDRVGESVANGQQYSRSGPLTSPRDANDMGQEFYGTVGLIFDAITYSSGDIFAAQFADLGIGPIIGVDPRTGGGGGNMVFHGTLCDLAPEALGLRPLPKDARLHFAIRRCRRNGLAGGELIEEMGVPAEHYLPVSSDDLLTGDRDLLHRAAVVLRGNRRRQFIADMVLEPEQVVIAITTEIKTIKVGATRRNQPLSLFIMVDGRQRETQETKDGRADVVIRRTGSSQALRIAVHELHAGSLQRLRTEPLAVYTRTIPALGAA
jgi:hypothetical protein